MSSSLGIYNFINNYTDWSLFQRCTEGQPLVTVRGTGAIKQAFAPV